MEDRRRLPLGRKRAAIVLALLVGVVGLGTLYASSASGFACDLYVPSSGMTGDWSATANWQGGMPTSATEVCWASDVTVTVDSGSQAALMIVGSPSGASGPLKIGGTGTLTLGDSSSDDSTVASLEIDPGGTFAGPGTIAVSGSLSITGGNIGVLNSPVAPTITSGSLTATNSGSIDYYAGSISVDGPVSIETTYFSSPNDGTASLTDTSPTNPITLIPGAYGEDDGYMTVTSADGYSISGDTDPLNYRLTQTGGTTVVPAGDLFYPGDTFELEGGTLQVDGILLGANVTGGTLDGTGSFDATVTNPSGTVAPGDAGGVGTLTVPSYVQGAGGTLRIPVNGTASGQFSVLDDSGTASIAGTLALEPDASFADSATPGELVEFLPYTVSLTGTFATTTVSPPLQNGETFGPAYEADQVDAVVGAGAPTLTGPPVITGTPQQGDTLSTTNGTWTGNPTYTYQWEDCPPEAVDAVHTPNVTSACTPISGATSSTYTLAASDVGVDVTVIVTAATSPTTTASATANEVGPVLPLAPTDTTAPTISGQTAPGDVLTCSPGTWTGDPAFTYVWERGGTPISGATADTYTLTAADEGHPLTCVVTGTNAGGSASATSRGIAIPTVASPAPAPTGGAAVHGTALPGDRLSCDPGTWTGDPTFTYVWVRGTSVIAGATTATYTVTILDEGMTVTCVITGHNAGGTDRTIANGVVVAQKGTLDCPKPSGTLTTAKVGPLALGASRLAERHSLKRYTVSHYGFDDFCLYGGWGIRAAYRSDKAVLLLTANPYYKLDGVSPGLTIKSVTKRLHVGKVLPIGLNDWYIAPGHGVSYVFKVRHGVIQEIGIANQHDTSGTRAKQRAFLAGFKAA